MFSFVYIAVPQSLLNRLPWLLGHECPSTGAGLLRQVARAIFCVVAVHCEVSYRHTAYHIPHTIILSYRILHTIISQIGAVCHTAYRILHTAHRFGPKKVSIKYNNEFVLSPLIPMNFERGVSITTLRKWYTVIPTTKQVLNPCKQRDFAV